MTELDNMETSSEGEDILSNSSDWSEADDSLPTYREEIDEVPEVALDLTTHSRMPLPFAVQPQTDRQERPMPSAASLTNLTSASAASFNAHELATTQAPSQFGANSSYVQYLVEKFSNYSVVTMNHVQFEINKVLFKADMGTYENAE